MLRPKGGYVPVGAGEGAVAGAAAGAAGGGMTSAVMTAVIVSVVAALVAAGACFIFIPVFLQMNDQGARIRLDEETTRLRLAQLESSLNDTANSNATTILLTELNNRLTVLEGDVLSLDFAIQNLVTNEVTMMNATYDLLSAGGYCETSRTCSSNLWRGPFTVYKATIGTVISLVVEIGPFPNEQMVGKRDSSSLRSESRKIDRRNNYPRAPAYTQGISCVPGGPIRFTDFLPIDTALPTYTAVRFFTAAQRNNMVLMGTTASTTSPRFNAFYNADNYRISFTQLSGIVFTWTWTVDWDPCTLGSNFDFASPTKFAIAYITPPGIDAKKK